MSERSERLKIGFVLDDSLDRPDGVQQYIMTLGSWLRAESHEVHYLVGETLRTDIANIHSLAKNFRVRFNKNKMSIPLPANKAKIHALLHELKLDVLHVQMPYNPLLAARVIKAADDATAVFGTFHIMPNSQTELKATKLLARVLKSSLQRFDKVYAVSAPARDFALSSFGVQASVMPNVVNINVIKQAQVAKDTDLLSIVFLGRLVERKGCGYLLKALAELSPKLRSSINVTICGSGPLETKLKNYVEQHNLVSMVLFTGYVSEDEKAKILAQADIAIFPSTGGESFGIVLIEAMAAGAGVVLGGDNPGYSSVLQDKRVLFDPTDTPALSRLLENYIGNSKLRNSLHAEQQKLVHDFDVGTVGPRILADYHKMIAKRRNN